MPLHAWLQACAYGVLVALGLALPLLGALLLAGPLRLLCALGFALLLLVALVALWIYVPRVTLRGLQRLPLVGPRLAPLLGPCPYQGPRRSGRVAITFDDGPNGADTVAVLDALARHGARATFFCVGRAAAAQPELLRRMAAEGHEIGNHTHDHRKLTWLSAAAIARQIDDAQAAITACGVAAPRWFRAPHGFKAPALLPLLRARGLALVAWTHGVWDTDRPGAAAIARRAQGHLRSGEILLLHDGGGDRSQTAAALEDLLRACAQRGLTAVTLSALLGPAPSPRA